MKLLRPCQHSKIACKKPKMLGKLLPFNRERALGLKQRCSSEEIKCFLESLSMDVTCVGRPSPPGRVLGPDSPGEMPSRSRSVRRIKLRSTCLTSVVLTTCSLFSLNSLLSAFSNGISSFLLWRNSVVLDLTYRHIF